MIPADLDLLPEQSDQSGRRTHRAEKIWNLPDAEYKLKNAIIRVDKLRANAAFAFPPGAYAIAVQFTPDDLKALATVVHAASHRLRDMIKKVAARRQNDRILHRRELAEQARAQAQAATDAESITYPDTEEESL